MDKFQNKYRIPTSRLQSWDYRLNGAYFITVCSQNRECLFGDIVAGKMELSEIGKIVNEEWCKSFEIRSELFCDSTISNSNTIHPEHHLIL